MFADFTKTDLQQEKQRQILFFCSFTKCCDWMSTPVILEATCWTWTNPSFLVVQDDSGGPMMCQIDGSWFQAAVLSGNNTATNQTRADPVMVFTKLSRYQSFLAQTVGAFLSPASTNSTAPNSTVSTNQTTTTTSGGSPAHPFFFFFHLFVFSAFLHLTL